MENLAVYQEAIRQWGKPTQRLMVIEECSELIKVLCDWGRTRATDDDVISEAVDVQLMLNQLRVMINDESKWDRTFAYKLDRVKGLLGI